VPTSNPFLLFGRLQRDGKQKFKYLILIVYVKDYSQGKMWIILKLKQTAPKAMNIF